MGENCVMKIIRVLLIVCIGGPIISYSFPTTTDQSFLETTTIDSAALEDESISIQETTINTHHLELVDDNREERRENEEIIIEATSTIQSNSRTNDEDEDEEKDSHPPPPPIIENNVDKDKVIEDAVKVVVRVAEDDEEFSKQTIARKSQEEVMNELQNIWHFSESLNDFELKNSLSSIVHLAYARVYTEPDETLYRLKQLLQRLRKRLTTSTEKQDIQGENKKRRRKREIVHSKEIEKIEKEIEKFLNNKENEISSNLIENVIDFDKDADDGNNNDDDYIKNKMKSETRLIEENDEEENNMIAPEDSIVLKEIKVKDRIPFIHNSSIIFTTVEKATTKLPIIKNKMDKKKKKKPIFNVNKSEQSLVSSLNGQITPMDNNTPNPIATFTTTLNLLNDLNKKPQEASQIATKIINLLYPAVKNVSALLSNNDNKLIEDKINSINLPRPSFLEIFENERHGVINSQKTNHNHEEETTNVSIYSQSEEDDEEEDDQEQGEETSSSYSSMIGQMIEDLSPTALLDGTSEGISNFVNGFTQLSFAAKLILFFCLSISIVSIGLGLFSLTQPLTFLGVISFFVPVALLLSLNQNRNKLNSIKRKKYGHENESATNKIDGELWRSKEDVLKILYLISDAYVKYKGKF